MPWLNKSEFRTNEVSAVKFKILIHPAEEGGFWAEVPAFPGCVSEGETMEEIVANIREAALGWLEVAKMKRNQPPSKC